MNMDAQEAALSLLSMGHNYFSQPTPSTSSATLNSILTTTASPVIPQKRKQSALEHQEFSHPANHVQYIPPQQEQHYIHLTHPHSPSRQRTSPQRSNGAEPSEQQQDGNGNDTSTEAVDCICGIAVDDGFSIACDKCSRWCHSACFGIAPGGVPDKFVCWTCQPRSAVEKGRAVRLQRERLLGLDQATDGDPKESTATTTTATTTKHRRRSSPGSERRQRRTTANSSLSAAAAAAANNAGAAADSNNSAGAGKRKRRPSIMQQPPMPTINQPPTTTTNGGTEEEQQVVEVENSEPWREAYVHIAQDVVPGDDTRIQLRRQAAHWRGVTAVSPLSDSPPVSVRPLTPQSYLNPFLFQNSNPLILPPAFALHTTLPIPSQTLITPFRSSITPSSSYLADPLNAYAHLGMPKPYVHLMGPPLDLALDARLVGNQGRFARCGCRPNAVLRPLLCDRGTKDSEDDTALVFGVFASRDLKADEEIVLGWEWDDGNAVHSLPALLEAHDTFPMPSVSTTNRPHEIQHLKNQMSNILHALSSTFTTCACGARAKECALTQMAAFVDGHPIGRRKGRQGTNDSDDETERIDVGPLIGRKRGFRTRERIPFSGGLGGMEMVVDDTQGVALWDKKKRRSGLPPPLPNFVISPSSPSPPSKKGKEKAADVVDNDSNDIEMTQDCVMTANSGHPDKRSTISIDNLVTPLSPHAEARRHPLSEPRPPDPQDEDAVVDFHVPEARLPPKMRKKWMHRELEARKDCTRLDNAVGRLGLGISFGPQDEQLLMPPPPMPASIDPTTVSSMAAVTRNHYRDDHPPYPQHQLCYSSPHETVYQSLSPSSHPSPMDSNLRPTSLSPSPSPVPNCPASTPSPGLASFANLSLLSPDLNNSLGSCRHSQQLDKVSCVTQTMEVKEESTICKPAVANNDDEPGLNDQPEVEERTQLPDATMGSPAPPSSAEPETVPSSYSQEVDDDCCSQCPETTAVALTVPSTSTNDCRSKPLELSVPHKEESEPHIPSSPVTQRRSLSPPALVPIDVSTSQSTSATTPEPAAAGLSEVTSPTLVSPSDADPKPPPPPKVKMTLKDFALRKKKQRQEMEMAVTQTQTSQVSPVNMPPALPDEKDKAVSLLEAEQGAKVNGRQDAEPTSNLVADKKLDMNGDKHAIGSPVSEEIPTEPTTNVDPSRKPSTTTLDEQTENVTSSATAHGGFNGYNPMSSSPSTTSKPPLLLPARPIKEALTTKSSKEECIQSFSSAPSLLQRVAAFECERSISPINPDPAASSSSKPQLEEDGEIDEIISPPPTTLLASTPIANSSKRDPSSVFPRPLSRTGPYSLPTGPRNFTPSSPSTVYRPPSSLSSTSASTPTTALPNNGSSNGSRLAPTAPRALRQSLQHHTRGPPASASSAAAAAAVASGPPPSQSPSIPNNNNNNNNNGGASSQYIPRGPSADRDRAERDHYRERERSMDMVDWDRHYRPPPPPPRWLGGFGSRNGRGSSFGR